MSLILVCCHDWSLVAQRVEHLVPAGEFRVKFPPSSMFLGGCQMRHSVGAQALKSPKSRQNRSKVVTRWPTLVPKRTTTWFENRPTCPKAALIQANSDRTWWTRIFSGPVGGVPTQVDSHTLTHPHGYCLFTMTSAQTACGIFEGFLRENTSLPSVNTNTKKWNPLLLVSFLCGSVPKGFFTLLILFDFYLGKQAFS